MKTVLLDIRSLVYLVCKRCKQVKACLAIHNRLGPPLRLKLFVKKPCFFL